MYNAIRHDSTAEQRGFTLIELLIVIGIIGFLAAAVLVAVDPVKRIQEARDARRYAEVNALLNSILNKQVDDRALYNGLAAVPIITQAGSNVQVIVRDSTGVACNVATTRPGCNKAMDTGGANKNCVADLDADGTTTPLVPNYIASIPVDPRGTQTSSTTPCAVGSGCTTEGGLPIDTSDTSTNTGYYLARTSGNRLEVGACSPEQTTSLSVRR